MNKRASTPPDHFEDRVSQVERSMRINRLLSFAIIALLVFEIFLLLGWLGGGSFQPSGANTEHDSGYFQKDKESGTHAALITRAGSHIKGAAVSACTSPTVPICPPDSNYPGAPVASGAFREAT